MFTGIVAEAGTVLLLGRSEIRVKAAQVLAECALGESIAVNGVCLTVKHIGTNMFAADISPETAGRSNLGALRPGDEVNLERALRLSERLNGHLVSGHVDCRGEVAKIEKQRDFYLLEITYPARFSPYLVEKGSVCVDGVSLTVVALSDPDLFSVQIIPATYSHTNIKNAKTGTKVNLEFDLVGKYIERLLPQTGRKITREFLTEHGF